MKLYRTTIEIWSNDDPSDLDLEDLARAATCGDMICTRQDTGPAALGECPRLDFFDIAEDHECPRCNDGTLATTGTDELTCDGCGHEYDLSVPEAPAAPDRSRTLELLRDVYSYLSDPSTLNDSDLVHLIEEVDEAVKELQ